MNIEQKSVNAIRVLAADTVQKANSGHPGMPLGSAAMAYELWANHLTHNPKNPKWVNRDRFILSAGHASSLLYSLLHLFGYGLTIEDMKNFRQDKFFNTWSSRIWSYCRCRSNYRTIRCWYGNGCRYGYGSSPYGSYF